MAQKQQKEEEEEESLPLLAPRPQQEGTTTTVNAVEAEGGEVPHPGYLDHLFPEDYDYDLTYSISTFFGKLRGLETGQGDTHKGNHPPPLAVVFWNWLGAFLGILLVGISEQHLFSESDLELLIGSYGATAVLLYAAPASPLSQPKNLIGGHSISAAVGVSCYKVVEHLDWPIWFGAALAVSLAIACMQLATVLHPPGGATAIIAVVGSERVHSAGYWFILSSTFGAALMLLVALTVNNIPRCKQMRYPRYWF